MYKKIISQHFFLKFLYLLIFLFVGICLCTRVHCTALHMWKLEDSLWELVLFYHLTGSRYQTQFVGHSLEYSYIRSQSPVCFLPWWWALLEPPLTFIFGLRGTSCQGCAGLNFSALEHQTWKIPAPCLSWALFWAGFTPHCSGNIVLISFLGYSSLAFLCDFSLNTAFFFWGGGQVLYWCSLILSFN